MKKKKRTDMKKFSTENKNKMVRQTEHDNPKKKSRNHEGRNHDTTRHIQSMKRIEA